MSEISDKLEAMANVIGAIAYNADPWKAEDAAHDAPFLRSAAAKLRALEAEKAELVGALSRIGEMDGDQPARTDWNMVHIATKALSRLTP